MPVPNKRDRNAGAASTETALVPIKPRKRTPAEGDVLDLTDSPVPRGRRASTAGDAAGTAGTAGGKRRRPPVGPSPQSRPIIGVLLVLLALLLLVAMFNYTPRQTFFGESDIFKHLNEISPKTETNILGALGATASVLLFNFAGIAAFFIPFALLVAGGLALFGQARKIFPWRVIRMLIAFLAYATLFAPLDCKSPHNAAVTLEITDIVPAGGGGTLGQILYNEISQPLIGELGSLIFFSLTFAYCVIGLFVDNPAQTFAIRIRWLRDAYLRKRRRDHELRLAREKAWREGRAARRAALIATGGTTAALENTTGTTAALENSATGTAAALGTSGTTGALENATGTDAETTGAEFTQPLPAAEDPLATPLTDLPILPTFCNDDDGSTAGTEAANTTATTTAADPHSEIRNSSFVIRNSSSASSLPSEDFSVLTTPPPPEIPTDAPLTPAPRPTARAAQPPGPVTVLGPEAEERADPSALAPKQRGNYKVPPIEILNPPEPPDESAPKEDFNRRANLIVNTLEDFNINTSIASIQVGPVVTRYEIAPSKGVKMEKISSFAKNITGALEAKSILIQAPIPGKSTVGIEVPNVHRTPVLVREILESKAWAERKGEIPIILGKEVTGKIMISDLAKMPHLLIAGSTGSGKSVCISCILASLIYHAGPADIRLILVDPKVVEMKTYERLPHLLIPVLTDMQKVPGALKWLIDEMERRYALFAKWRVRNIAGMNAKITKDRAAAKIAKQLELELSPEERIAAADALSAISVQRDEGVIEDEMPREKLPYIVCIIDEFADLMLQAPADIETGVNRLAAKARAAGIHLILATQRPEAKVVTGGIKANLPSRIAFKVMNPIDSGIILGGKGAESLIGKGDMLFIPPGTAEHQRVQGAFLDDDEIERVVDTVVERNGEAEFDDTVSDAIEAHAAKSAEEEDDGLPTEGTDDPDQDPVFKKALDLFRSEDKASTSFLQRRLGLGFGRAARIVDAIADAGYIVKESNKPNAPWKVVR